MNIFLYLVNKKEGKTVSKPGLVGGLTRFARAAMNRGISAHACFKAQEGMQSLVAENFMRVVGTHIYRAKVQKIAHFTGASRPFFGWIVFSL
jgi:hypothetical protein